MEILLLIACFIGWLVLGGLTLWTASKDLFKKRVSLRRAMLTQLAMVWVLPIWLIALFEFFSDPFFSPNREIWMSLPYICIPIQILIVAASFRLRLLPAAVCLLLSLVPGYMSFRMSMPGCILMAGARAVATKARGEMRQQGTVLQNWMDSEGALPFPVDRGGNTLAGIPRSASEDDQTLVYYRGPSFLPEAFVQGSDRPTLLVDPFRRKDPAPYAYAAGPVQGATAAFILSSWGPDEFDQSDEVERMFLIDFKGNTDRARESEAYHRLKYSPTNGVVSEGELFYMSEKGQ